MPVNCCTMARKLVVSVLRRVVGAFLEARERRRGDLPTRPSMLEIGPPVVFCEIVWLENDAVLVTMVESARPVLPLPNMFGDV